MKQPMNQLMRNIAAAAILFAGAAACSDADNTALPVDTPARTGITVAVTDTTLPDMFEATGVAAPFESATLSTRIMATVSAVRPLEGSRVKKGDLLVQLDTRDIDAKRTQVTAAVAEATAAAEHAEITARRIRALHADSAAPRAQLDAAETGLARATAGLTAARGAMAELEAAAAYTEVRAPFDGVVVKRFVDPGALAAPGAPLLTVEATDRLRIAAALPAPLARGLARGNRITVRIEGETVDATIEGAVPDAASLYRINAIVPNSNNHFLAGSAATVLIPNGSRDVVLVPTDAIIRQGELTGVHRVSAGRQLLTWIVTGPARGTVTEVLSGLSKGDSVVITPAGSR